MSNESMHFSANVLFEVAVRVLRHCARGRNPHASDVQFLEQNALPNEVAMTPDELAGTMIWRMHIVNSSMN